MGPAGTGGTGEGPSIDRELWEISVPCTALNIGMRGEVERAKTVDVTEGRVTGKRVEVGGWGERVAGKAEVVRRVEMAVVGSVGGRVVVVVDGIKCWVVTIVGVTWAVGADVVCLPIGRMLAVGVVVTVGLTAAVGAVDWEVA